MKEQAWFLIIFVSCQTGKKLKNENPQNTLENVIIKWVPKRFTVNMLKITYKIWGKSHGQNQFKT